MESIKGNTRMTAVAKLPEPEGSMKWTRSAGVCINPEPGYTADQMREYALAALSPAELGGVEKEKPAATVSVVMGRMGEVAPHCVILSDEHEAWLDNQPFGTVHRLYSTPRAAEASDAAALRLDDYLCNEHGICIGKQAAIAALAFALTPPSAKGEKE